MTIGECHSNRLQNEDEVTAQVHQRMLLLCVVANISLGCGSAGGVAPEPFPRLAVALDPSVTVTAASLALTSTAMSLSGTPYRAGGDTLHAAASLGMSSRSTASYYPV